MIAELNKNNIIVPAFFNEYCDTSAFEAYFEHMLIKSLKSGQIVGSSETLDKDSCCTLSSMLKETINLLKVTKKIFEVILISVQGGFHMC